MILMFPTYPVTFNYTIMPVFDSCALFPPFKKCTRCRVRIRTQAGTHIGLGLGSRKVPFKFRIRLGQLWNEICMLQIWLQYQKNTNSTVSKTKTKGWKTGWREPTVLVIVIIFFLPIANCSETSTKNICIIGLQINRTKSPLMI